MKDGFTLELLEGDIGGVGQPVLRVAQHHAMADFEDTPFQTVAQGEDTGLFVLHER